MRRRDKYFKAAMSFANWKINPRIVRAFVDKSGDTIRWLEELGVKFQPLPRARHWPLPTFQTKRRSRGDVQ